MYGFRSAGVLPAFLLHFVNSRNCRRDAGATREHRERL